MQQVHTSVCCGVEMPLPDPSSHELMTASSGQALRIGRRRFSTFLPGDVMQQLLAARHRVHTCVAHRRAAETSPDCTCAQRIIWVWSVGSRWWHRRPIWIAPPRGDSGGFHSNQKPKWSVLWRSLKRFGYLSDNSVWRGDLSDIDCHRRSGLGCSDHQRLLSIWRYIYCEHKITDIH